MTVVYSAIFFSENVCYTAGHVYCSVLYFFFSSKGLKKAQKKEKKS